MDRPSPFTPIQVYFTPPPPACKAPFGELSQGEEPSTFGNATTRVRPLVISGTGSANVFGPPFIVSSFSARFHYNSVLLDSRTMTTARAAVPEKIFPTRHRPSELQLKLVPVVWRRRGSVAGVGRPSGRGSHSGRGASGRRNHVITVGLKGSKRFRLGPDPDTFIERTGSMTPKSTKSMRHGHPLNYFHFYRSQSSSMVLH